MPSDVGLWSGGGSCELVEIPLLLAAWAGHLSVVKLLVERGADIRLKNELGQTTSDVSRSKGKEDVAEWLGLVNCR